MSHRFAHQSPNRSRHSAGLPGSGASTPGRTGSSTPLEDDSTAVSSRSDESCSEKDEKALKRKSSFKKATLAGIPATPSDASAMSKEHSEQGRVKWDVYFQYMQAASWLGCGLFLLLSILQQVVSVLSTIVLRAWGEHNRNAGGNSELGKFLFAYGMTSLLSVLLGAVAGVIMWVYISLRSARRLHDAVCDPLYIALLYWSPDVNTLDAPRSPPLTIEFL